MTLILSVICPHFSIIACDKKVTNAATQSTLNRYANKMLLVLRKNGLFSICYTGIAQVDGISMDRILASYISGIDLSKFLGVWWTKADFDDIGLCLMRVKSKLEALWKRLDKRARLYPFQLVVTGYQFQNKPLLVWPAHYVVSKPPGSSANFYLTCHINKRFMLDSLANKNNEFDIRVYGSVVDQVGMKRNMEQLAFCKDSNQFETRILELFVASSVIDPTVGDLLNTVRFGPLLADDLATVKCFHSRDIAQDSCSFPFFVSDRLLIQAMQDFDFNGFEIGCGWFKVGCKTEEINII